MHLTTNHPGVPATLRRYPIRKSQNGPKSSPQTVELKNPHLTGIDKFTPIVTRTGDGQWRPVTEAKDVASLIRESSQPDSSVQLGTWTDQKRGWFKPADGEIQNDEVTSMHERLGWQYEICLEDSDGSLVEAHPMPEEAEIVSHRGPNAVLGVPYYLS